MGYGGDKCPYCDDAWMDGIHEPDCPYGGSRKTAYNPARHQEAREPKGVITLRVWDAFGNCKSTKLNPPILEIMFASVLVPELFRDSKILCVELFHDGREVFRLSRDMIHNYKP